MLAHKTVRSNVKKKKFVVSCNIYFEQIYCTKYVGYNWSIHKAAFFLGWRRFPWLYLQWKEVSVTYVAVHILSVLFFMGQFKNLSASVPIVFFFFFSKICWCNQRSQNACIPKVIFTNNNFVSVSKMHFFVWLRQCSGSTMQSSWIMNKKTKDCIKKLL